MTSRKKAIKIIKYMYSQIEGWEPTVKQIGETDIEEVIKIITQQSSKSLTGEKHEDSKSRIS